MKSVLKFSFILLLALFFVPHPAQAVGTCFCSMDNGVLKPPTECRVATKPECENWKTNEKFSPSYKSCVSMESVAACDNAVRDWKAKRSAAIPAVSKEEAEGAKIIPKCVLEDKLSLEGECGDVTIFVTLLLNITRYLFSIIGALALLVFIYGGFLMILSAGNTEKVQQGKDAMMAAVIGLVVAFGGYLLIQFLGTGIGLKEEFRLK